MKYELLEHTADIRIRAYGEALPELFVNAAIAMMDIIFGENPKLTHSTTPIKLSVKGQDLDSLLVNWLSEELFLTQTEYSIAQDIKIEHFGENEIRASQIMHSASAIEDIKAVTYNDLVIKQAGEKYIAEVTFDI